MSEGRVKRRIFVINRAFQWKVILKIYLVLLMTVIVLSGAMYVLSDNLLSSDSLFDYFSTARSTSRLLAPTIYVTAVSSLTVGILFVTFSFIVVTHRIAGPIFHLHRVVEQMTKGDLTVDPHTRAHDEFKDLSMAVAGLLEMERRLVAELRRDLSRLEGESLSGEAKEALERIKKQLEAFKLDK